MTASSSTPTRPYRYDLSRFDSPQLGDPAPTVVATDQHGRTIDLADLRGQWVVLELGSLTCNMFASKPPRHRPRPLRPARSRCPLEAWRARAARSGSIRR